MPTQEIRAQRFSVISGKAFTEVVRAIDAKIGHPDMAKFRADVAASRSDAQLEEVVSNAVGPTGLMEFARFDIGEVLRKELGEKARQSVRLVAGNPLIMKQMVKHVPDAASYAPVTILIDERADGVHLSYDRMASFLATYGNQDALKVAQDLDKKVEALLMESAS